MLVVPKLNLPTEVDQWVQATSAAIVAVNSVEILTDPGLTAGESEDDGGGATRLPRTHEYAKKIRE
jgi:hypothetical protein